MNWNCSIYYWNDWVLFFLNKDLCFFPKKNIELVWVERFDHWEGWYIRKLNWNQLTWIQFFYYWISIFYFNKVYSLFSFFLLGDNIESIANKVIHKIDVPATPIIIPAIWGSEWTCSIENSSNLTYLEIKESVLVSFFKKKEKEYIKKKRIKEKEKEN